MSAEERLAKKLAEMGLTLPAAAAPKGLYRPVVVVGNLAYTSGHLPVTPDGQLVTGRVGDDLDVERGQKAAALAGLGILATLKAELGSLDRVVRLVKLLGLVNCTPDFTQQPAVINGASDVLGEIFGDAGVHARSAVGVSELPLDAPVEVELIVEVEG